MGKEKKYHLYVLLKNDKPIYIGVTTNVKNRVSSHKKDKDFNGVFIIKSYHDKKEAYAAESSVIRFNGLFDIGLVNAKNVTDVFVSEIGYSHYNNVVQNKIS